MADDTQPDDTTAPDLGVIADSFASVLRTGFDVGSVMKWAINNGVQFIVALIGVIMRGLTRIGTVVANGFQKVLEQDNPELGRLAVSILGTMFGRELADKIPGGILSPGNLDENAEAVGGAVLTAVFGPLNVAEGASIEPGVERAEGFLGAITNLVTRGFVMDLLEEVVPHWHFNFIHNLEHELISGLGLGRVARTVLRPIVTTLVSDPAQWALNLAYRPKLLAEGVAIELWLTGQIDSARLDDELGRQGWSSDRIDALVASHVKRLGVTELLTLNDHGLIDDAEATRRVNLLGYDTSGANDAWTAAKFARLNHYLDQAAAVWLDKYASGFIDHDTFVNSIRALGLPDDVAQAIVNVGGAHVETPRRLLSWSEVKDAWTKNLITQDEAHDYAIRLGYSEDDAQTLIVLNVATIRDKAEADQLKKDAAAARAAKTAADQAAKAAAAAAAKQAAAQAAAEKAAAAAAQKAKIAADKIALQQFALDAAEQKQKLVDGQKQAGLISTDQAALATAQIAADLAALLASIDGQEADAKASFARQILALQQADRAATVQQALDDIDLQLEADQAVRAATIALRLQTVADTLAQKLSDITDSYAARRASIDQDLTDGLAAIDIATLPSTAERAAAAQDGIAALDATLTRKLADLTAEFNERRTANNDNLASGLIKPTAHDLKVTALQLAEDQGKRLATQQHDLSVARLQAVAAGADSVAAATADVQKQKLQAAATKQRDQTAAAELQAQLAARHAADVETITLKGIAAQVAPISEAAAATKRRKVQATAAAAARKDAITETEIAKGEADAASALAKAQATATAAKQRLQQAQAAAPARESALAAATAAQQTLQASIDAKRAELEARLAADQAGINPGGAAA